MKFLIETRIEWEFAIVNLLFKKNYTELYTMQIRINTKNTISFFNELANLKTMLEKNQLDDILILFCNHLIKTEEGKEQYKKFISQLTDEVLVEYKNDCAKLWEMRAKTSEVEARSIRVASHKLKKSLSLNDILFLERKYG